MTTTMMSELQVFKFEEMSDVRILMRDGDPWFVGKDVCDCLDIKDARISLNLLDDDDRCSIPVTDSLNRLQDTILISESGLYSLILRSRKPEAKKFKKWVTSEVLPSIRKHGAYMTPEKLHEVMSDPRNLAALLTNLADEQDKNKKLAEEIVEKDNTINIQQAKIAVDAPKVSFAETVISHNHDVEIATLANLLCQNGFKVGRNRLFEIFRDNGILISSGDRYNCPTQRFIDAGHLKITYVTYKDKTGNSLMSTKTMVTPKGQIYFINKFKAGKLTV